MMAVLVSNLLSGVKPSFNTALTSFDIVAVEDVAQGLRLVGDCRVLPGREYYIGSGLPRPLRGWLDEVRRVLGSEVPIGFGERPDDGLEFDERWFDIGPLAAATGYAPKVGFADAVGAVAEWVVSSHGL